MSKCNPNVTFNPDDESVGRGGKVLNSDYVGIREFKLDFENNLALLDGATLDLRPDSIAFDYKTAFSQGPVAIGDISEGATSYIWRARVDNSVRKVYLSREESNNWGVETELFSFFDVDIDELDVAFDQNANVLVCAQRATGVDGALELWLYWFNPHLGAFSFENFGSGKSPRILLDYPPDTSISDVLIFYVDSVQGIVYRQQRDAFAIVNTTPVINTNVFIEDVVFLNDWRLSIIYSKRDSVTGKYSLNRLTTSLYPVPSDPEKLQSKISFTDASIPIVLIDQVIEVDQLQSLVSFLSATMVAPIIDETIDFEQMQSLLSYISSTLVQPLIVYTMYDIDQLKSILSFTNATMPVVVIQNTLFDVGQMKSVLSFTSATLA